MKTAFRRLRMGLCLLLCLCLCSCSAQVAPLPDATLPPMEPGPAAPVGDTSLRYYATVPLYLPSVDGQTLLTYYDTLAFTVGKHPAEAILTALLGHEGNDRVASLGGNVELTLAAGDSLVLVGGVCTVNLAASANLLSPEKLYVAALAISATLCELDDIDYVTLLIAGSPAAMDVSGNLPLGVIADYSGLELPILWDQFDAKRAPVGTLASATPRSAAAVLYFPLADGSGISAEPRTLSFPGQHPQQLILTLMEALSAGAALMADAAPMPNMTAHMLFMPEAVELEGGGRRANLYFSAALMEELSRIGCDPLCFFAALTMTLTSFVPALQQVSFQMGNAALAAVPSQVHGERTFPGALHTREHYIPLVMGQATLYIPGEGGLMAKTASLHYQQTQSPRALLMLLSQHGALPALTNGDILGIAIHDGTLLINFSEDFAQAVRRSADQRMIAYSAVTTLCRALELRRVRFYFGGSAVDELGSDLTWSGEFLYNPAMGEK